MLVLLQLNSDEERLTRETFRLTLGSLHVGLGPPFFRPRYSGPLSLLSGFVPLQLLVPRLNRDTAPQFRFDNTSPSSRSVCTLVVTSMRLLTRISRTLAAECVATTCIIAM